MSESSLTPWGPAVKVAVVVDRPEPMVQAFDMERETGRLEGVRTVVVANP